MAVVKNDNWIRRFEVSDPRKHKNGFTVYKVTSVVFPRSAPEASTSIVVWKRYNDFKKLHESLKHYHRQCKISEELPQLCKGKYFKRFEENVIKDRINFALELLNFIGRHQILFTSDPFLKFFNNGYHVSETTSAGEGNPEICLNGNNSDLSNDLLDPDLKSFRDGSSWDSRSSTESMSINCDYTDEESNVTSDTPDFLSPVHSVDSLSSFKSSNQDGTLDVVDASSSLLDQRTVEPKKPSKPEADEEIVTCHSEKPMEICLSVRTQDFGSAGDSLLHTEWITPPGTPSGRQDYLVEAAYHVGEAQKYEVDGAFEAAFCFYKAAIACLLSGVQDDDDKFRRQAVREKTNQYLQRAEKIYALHLAPDRESGPKKVTEAVEELKMYKVLGVIDSVMLVLNVTDERCYVIKVLQKSSCPAYPKKKTIIPYNVPYMVKLTKYFENENSIFLVMEYAHGGKLWDRLEEFTVRNVTEREFYSCSSRNSRYELSDLCGNEVQGSAQRHPIPIQFHLEVESPVLSESEKEDESNPARVDLETLEVENLVENSQKLLNSVSKTLLKSERLTNNLNKELNDIETVFDMKCKLLASSRRGVKYLDAKNVKKRSRSAGLRPKFERSYSSEDLTDSRPRTASNSVDRRSEWSKSSSFRLPESVIRGWASELLVALETLHRWGIVCRDLHPGNVLLGEEGHLLLTFQAHWQGVDSLVSEEAASGMYAAPEITSVFPVTSAADWWSFGALLHFLFTGKDLASCYPEGILGHTILTFPDFLSPEACSLLRELLRFEPGERLGGGVNGAEEIKCHPFFNFVDWQIIYNNC